ncbi:MAG: ORF6N domain-containing protein [Desulfobacterales bacterium]|nr:MAG: ORF6N domain-containing protein [Desulfobacterales bacterium]
MTQKEIKKVSVSIEKLTGMIYSIRGQKIMLSTQLADLYGVEPRVLVQAVKRNIERFPKDFMFQLTSEEFTNLKSQIVTSSWGGMRRSTPYAFTEQGVAMLSSVLRSKRAVQVNIEIMRAFVKLRKMLTSHKELAHKLADLEKKYDEQFAIVFEAIQQLLEEDEKPKKKIGYIKERQAKYGNRSRKN